MSTLELRNVIAALLESQLYAVLATVNGSAPHGSLVAIAASRDLSRIYFCTPVATRKYRNIERNARVTLTLDNRDNCAGDVGTAVALTAYGAASVIAGEHKAEAEALYIGKHPHLASFVDGPGTRLMEVRIARYSYAERFQNVYELEMG